jgi:hypothetical protein
MADVDLWHALRSFTRSAWRLEARDEYASAGEVEALAAWRRGETPRNQGWLDLLAEHISAGHQVGRVHAITLPPTEYIQFELATYPANVEAGESVAIADRARHPELDVDFWIFDDRRVVVLHYDDTGRFIQALDGTHHLAHYRRLRDVAITAATPLADWTSTVAHRP